MHAGVSEGSHTLWLRSCCLVELVAASLSDIGLLLTTAKPTQPPHSHTINVAASSASDPLSRGNVQRTTMSSGQTGLTLFAEWIDHMLGPKATFEGDQLDDMGEASHPGEGRNDRSSSSSRTTSGAGGASSAGSSSSGGGGSSTSSSGGGVGKGAAVVSQGTMEFACLALCDR